jgi:hypothetical protein
VEADQEASGLLYLCIYLLTYLMVRRATYCRNIQSKKKCCLNTLFLSPYDSIDSMMLKLFMEDHDCI